MSCHLPFLYYISFLHYTPLYLDAQHYATLNCRIIVYYMPRRIMRVITRRTIMLAGERSRGAISPASILSESRN